MLSLGDRPLVMGILNVTPDSFANERPCLDTRTAVELACRMEAEGADLVDVGGESSRPGATPVTLDDEMARVIPVVRALAGRLRVPISVDTCKGEVARAALAEGASIVNDITGLQADRRVGEAVAEAGAAVVVMHMRGRPATMQSLARYDDVVAEVCAELRACLDTAAACGIPPEGVIVDPGIGFAKDPAHSYGVLARLPEIARALGRPLLVGPSRKSFMRAALADRPAVERDWGTAAAVTAAVLGGAHIVRVHAVGAMVQVVRVAEDIRKAG